MTVLSTSPAPQHRFSIDGGKQLLTLELPMLESLSGVDLDIGSTELRLLLPGSCKHVRIPIPSELGAHQGTPTAKFSRKRGQLTVTWALVEAEPPTVSTPKLADNVKNVEEGSAVNPNLPVGHCVSEASVSSHAGDEKEFECLEEVEEEIADALKQCTVRKLKDIASLGGARVLLSDFAVNGEAIIKKRCCEFKVSVTFTWEVLDAFGGFLGAKGGGQILGFTQDDSSPEVTIRASTSGSVQAKTAVEWMRRHGASLISESLIGKDVCEAVLSEWEDPATDAMLETQPSPNLDREALTQWAQEWLQQKLAALSVKLFGGSASAVFATPQVSGEVAMSVKDGLPVVAFQLRVECTWTICTTTSKAEGTLVVPDFTTDRLHEDYAIHVDTMPGKKVSGQLLTAFRQTGVSAVRNVLARFASELEVHVGS